MVMFPSARAQQPLGGSLASHGSFPLATPLTYSISFRWSDSGWVKKMPVACQFRVYTLCDNVGFELEIIVVSLREEDATFPYGRAWGALFVLQTNLFQGHQVFCEFAATLEYRCVCALYDRQEGKNMSGVVQNRSVVHNWFNLRIQILPWQPNIQ